MPKASSNYMPLMQHGERPGSNPMAPEYQFQLTEFNEIRHQRGAPAARVEITFGDESGWLWMTRQDAGKNITQFGSDPELLRVIEAYRIGRLPAQH